MNTALTTRSTDRDDHPPPTPLTPTPLTTMPLSTTAPRAAPRLRLIDRLALRVGLALITWSRRQRATEAKAVESRERRANRVEQQLATLERERAAERMLRLTVPLR
jgi:hypothetical protein